MSRGRLWSLLLTSHRNPIARLGPGKEGGLRSSQTGGVRTPIQDSWRRASFIRVDHSSCPDWEKVVSWFARDKAL